MHDLHCHGCEVPGFLWSFYLVAEEMESPGDSTLARQNIWAVAAAGDPGAKPSMDTIMAQLDAAGDRVIEEPSPRMLRKPRWIS